MKNKTLNSLFAVLIGLVLFVPNSLAAAFGIAPPFVTNENLKPGSNFVYVIDLNTNDPAHDMLVETEITGDEEIMKWVTIRDAKNLMMPRGQQHVPMYVDLNVPADAKVGKYKGGISVTVKPKQKASQGGDIAILLGGHLNVDLNVVDYDVTDYWVKAVSLNPVTEGQPLRMKMTLKNLGNTALTSVKTNVEVLDYKTEELISSGSAEQLSGSVYPHTVKDVDLTADVPSLSPGNYWVNVSVLKEGESIYQNRLYLAVTAPDVNNVLRTSVDVGKKGDLKPVAMPFGQDSNNVQVQTSVTVRAPLTNQLIGVVIILLGVLILITARIHTHMYTKRHRK
ncbi:hypothetical protein KAR91_01485 [Candidatus Pacearchaeota archaeon]|nr:hypothetical protein [Candidatus Pacearchaeota archaeon]